MTRRRASAPATSTSFGSAAGEARPSEDTGRAQALEWAPLMPELEEQDWAAVTRLLKDADRGSKEALDRLFVLLYDKLRGMSHRFLAAHARHETLSTTALVHEAYLKLSRDHDWTARDREHFLSISARAMRQIVVDAARARGADKRGRARDDRRRSLLLRGHADRRPLRRTHLRCD